MLIMVAEVKQKREHNYEETESNMTGREKVMTVLRGGCVDKVPFTLYENKMPRCYEERILRNRGLCIVSRVPSFKIVYPNTPSYEIHTEDPTGKRIIETHWETSAGALSSIKQDSGYTKWSIRYPFQSPDDYKAIKALLTDATVVPMYNQAAALDKLLGGDFVMRDQIPYEPLQEIIINIMGTETFCYEWMENRDEIMSL
jgi:hypothetical protein